MEEGKNAEPLLLPNMKVVPKIREVVMQGNNSQINP